jgi:hypothetical protein
VFVVAGNPRFAARHGNDIPATLLKQMSQHVAASMTSAVRFAVGICTLSSTSAGEPVGDAETQVALAWFAT